jgi:hypothetical protein
MQETSALSTVYDNEVNSGTFEGIITMILQYCQNTLLMVIGKLLHYCRNSQDARNIGIVYCV